MAEKAHITLTKDSVTTLLFEKKLEYGPRLYKAWWSEACDLSDLTNEYITLCRKIFGEEPKGMQFLNTMHGPQVIEEKDTWVYRLTLSAPLPSSLTEQEAKACANYADACHLILTVVTGQHLVTGIKAEHCTPIVLAAEAVFYARRCCQKLQDAKKTAPMGFLGVDLAMSELCDFVNHQLQSAYGINPLPDPAVLTFLMTRITMPEILHALDADDGDK